MDATLRTTSGEIWRAVCITEDSLPHRIVAMRFHARPAPQRNKAGYAVVLGGTSSVGKSTLAACLQDRLDGPWLHIDRDGLLLRLRGDYQLFPETWGPIVEGLNHAVRALVETGNLVIFDTLFEQASDASACRHALSGVPVLFVSVTCAPEVAAAREATRSDRAPGLAMSQAKQRTDFDADVVVDTTDLNPQQAAELVLASIPTE